MKTTYNRPELVKYGSLETLTLGSGGTEPDFRLPNVVTPVNNTCVAGGTATACLLPNS